LKIRKVMFVNYEIGRVGKSFKVQIRPGPPVSPPHLLR
jgi:hypothetical protein